MLADSIVEATQTPQPSDFSLQFGLIDDGEKEELLLPLLTLLLMSRYLP